MNHHCMLGWGLPARNYKRDRVRLSSPFVGVALVPFFANFDDKFFSRHIFVFRNLDCQCPHSCTCVCEVLLKRTAGFNAFASKGMICVSFFLSLVSNPQIPPTRDLKEQHISIFTQ